MRMSKNDSSYGLCSTVNFIVECRFGSRLCNSLMSTHWYFQNMKQSSKYIFHDLVNSPLMLLAYFSFFISYRFSSKYVKFKVAYVDAILVNLSCS